MYAIRSYYALGSTEDEGRGLELGAVDYITKPFNPGIVRARVRNHLRFVRQRKLLEQLAKLDVLTEIPNRRRFDEELDVITSYSIHYTKLYDRNC